MEISEWDKLKEKWEKLSGLICTMPTKIENGGFTLKTQQMFLVHTTPGKFEKATISGHFVWSWAWEKLGQGRHTIVVKFSRTFIFENVFCPQSQPFHISLVQSAFPQSSIFMMD